MENESEEVPRRGPLVGIVYNLKRAHVDGSTPDQEAEYDSMDTVLALQAALARAGVQTALYEADETLPEHFIHERPAMVFNIAEGRGGRAREAQVPALLTLLGIPFTGSDETTLCVALDKALTKRVLTTYRVKTPRHVVFEPGARYHTPALHYPVIVKPNAEGSSKGIGDVCVAASAKALREIVTQNLARYGEAMLAEEYIEGREFTVGLLGNGDELRVFPPLEICFAGKPAGDYPVYSYPVKQNYKDYIRYDCPQDTSDALRAQLMSTAKRVFHALGCRDFARVDFRTDAQGRVYFIEINPLPGLAPGYSDYPMLAEFSGMPYDTLVCSILRVAAKRCGVAL